MRTFRRSLLVWEVFLVLGLVGVASAAEIPFLAGRINDNAGILSAATITRLETLLKDHEDSTSNQIVVLTIASLEGEVLEEYAIRVAQTWGLGQKGKDNGVLLLVARDDRKVRIEVGRGLEGQLTDVVSGVIIRKEIIPAFKDGDYDRGVTAGVEAIVSAIQGAYTADESSEALAEGAAGIVGFLIFLFVVGIFTLVALVTSGCMSWFLYVFLLPFWLLFPAGFLGEKVGLPLFGLYALGFPLVKLWFARSPAGKRWVKAMAASGVLRSAGTGGSGGGWSGGSSGGFSGGGGSFSGGGSSGSW
jgi:uncharacterized protein